MNKTLVIFLWTPYASDILTATTKKKRFNYHHYHHRKRDDEEKKNHKVWNFHISSLFLFPYAKYPEFYIH